MKNHDAEDVRDAVRRFLAPGGRHTAPLWVRAIGAVTFPVRIVVHYAGRLAEHAGLITTEAAPAVREVSR